MGIPVGDDNIIVREAPIVNTTLIVLNILVFIIAVLFPWLLLPGARSYADIVYSLGFIPLYFISGERLYALITSMFLHGNLIHLIGNMLFLYIFGDNIEIVMGRVRYLVFYLLSGIIASVIHTITVILFDPQALLVPAIGASGAISGVLGAYIVLFPWSRVRIVTMWGWIPVFMSLPAILYIGLWFIYQLLMGLTTAIGGVSIGIAFWAHIGGFIAGLIIAPLLADRRKVLAARSVIEYY
ncbi:MAG: rhomboid family intramembrane serine protease [Acidilobaceae archaeon]